MQNCKIVFFRFITDFEPQFEGFSLVLCVALRLPGCACNSEDDEYLIAQTEK